MKTINPFNIKGDGSKLSQLSLILSLLLCVASANFYAQTTVNTLAQLRAAVQLSDQNITMQPGNYNIEDLPSNQRYFPCSGSNNTIDLTGVYIEFPVDATTVEHFLITGNSNTLIGGEFENTYASGITEVTDFVAYNNDRTNLANGARPHIAIKGSNNSVIGTKMTVRGSFPYGYGSYFGIGGNNTYGLDKRAGIEINGAYTTIDGCELQMRAFGHGIYIGEPSLHTTVKNTLVEGVVRKGSDLLADGPNSLLAQNDYKDNDGNDIDPDDVISLCEDGIRMYNGGGAATIENCVVKKMRGGIKMYLASAATVTNSTSIDCGDVNYNMPHNGTIINSIGNFTYEELCDWGGNRNGYDAEWTILPSPNATGPHNIMDVKGNDHNLVFHRSPGPFDNTTRAIVVTGNNSTIVNETEYAIILESGTSGNVVTSCGPVTDNGRNSVSSSSSCDFSCGDFDAYTTIEAESYCDQSGTQTETTADAGVGQNVGYIDTGDWIRFDDVDFGNGAESVDVRVASRTTGGTIEFRLGSTSGTLIGTASVPVTGGWQTWTTVSANINGASGTHDLYLLFTAGGININWFEFTAGTNPVGNNIALYGTATQSSTAYSGEASRAIDGNTSGNWSDGSVTHTAADTSNPWWEVDLGGTFDIDHIDIYNRTNCCSERLSNFTVSVIDGSTTTFSQTFASHPDPSISINTSGAIGNVVRVQINGTGTLSLAEVEVYGTPGASCASFSTIQAEDFNNMSGVVDEGSNVGYLQDGDWVMYSNIDLTCAASFDVRASSPTNGGNVEVRLGSSTGTLIGTVSVSTTGSWNNWSTFSASINSTSGQQDVYLVFTGGSGYLFNLDWLEFSASSSSRIASGFQTAETLEGEIGISVYPN
ncbi:MAG: carbohydrate-binding protein, partial [Marinoscillum sp.]